MRRLRKCLLSLAVLISTTSALAGRVSEDHIWTLHPRSDTAAIHPRFGHQPRAFEVARIDSAELHFVLDRAPLEIEERQIRAGLLQESRPTLSLPMPDGSFMRVEIEQSPILSPELQARYPDIRTYRLQGIDHHTVTGRLDETPLGLHAQLLMDHDAVYIDPADEPNLYIVYRQRDLVVPPFRCAYQAEEPIALRPETNSLSHRRANGSGPERQLYRLAVSTTGEYTAYFHGVDGATAQIATTVNRVTGIYERELAIRFQLVATRVFADKTTDPFTPENQKLMLEQNQTELDANVGSGFYDLGIVLDKAFAGGLASLGSACVNGRKGKAVAALDVPSGDPFDVDIVAHEIGHELGATHSFDDNDGRDIACQVNREPSSAYEPGTGSTIMGYGPGACGYNFIQDHADPYFHIHSLEQIMAYVATSGTCAFTTTTGNRTPVPNAGADFTVPPGTPFTLTGSATDLDGDALTYCWEQYDLGPGIGRPAPDYSGPLFRSYPPSSDPSRTIPPMQALIDGTPTPFEVLPDVFRDLTFRFTVRDNRGGTDSDVAVVHVNGAPLRIASPVSSLECGAQAFLSAIGGSGSSPRFRALLSTDNGQTFPTTVLANTGGVDFFTVPRTLTQTAWMKLEAIGNIYFALKGPLTIVDTRPPTITAPPSAGFIECTQCSPRGALLRLPATAAATDLCDASPNITNDAPPMFPLGHTTVTWTARDASGNVGTAQQFIDIVDSTPPSISAPADVTVECSAPSGTAVSLGNATVSDICWCSQVNVTSNAPALFARGTTAVTWTATDGSGNSSTARQNVTVQDTTAPALDVELTPNVLWPPNNQMAIIRARVTTLDVCDSRPAIRLLSISNNLPSRFATDIDAQIGVDTREFQLRAETPGKELERIYTVTYEARDAGGNRTVKQALVTVPRERP